MDRLTVGGKLHNGQKLMSPNGKYELRMQEDGNLVLYDAGTSIWSTNTAGSGAAYLEVQEDGNVVLHNHSAKPVWASNTRPNAGVSLALRDDRNLVIYPETGELLWSTRTFVATEKTAGQPPAPEIPVAAPPKAKSNARTYKVIKGESLWRIAEKFYGDGTQYRKIAKANNIPSADLIRPGQTLLIPE